MIEISQQVYQKFLKFALESASPFKNRRTWKECIGLILGQISSNNDIIVTDIIPMDTGTAVYVDISDYERVFSLVPFSKIEGGEVIVGWAHSHPGLGLFFSSTDIQTQFTYQNIHPLTFGLVMDPTKITANFPGFHIYRVDKTGTKVINTNYLLETPADGLDFLRIKDKIISELTVPPLVPPLEGFEAVQSWNGIYVILTSYPKKGVINQPLRVELQVKLPTRQFVRLDYRMEADDNLKIPHFSFSRKIFHETIDSGTLASFTFYPQKAGTHFIKLTKLKISDYRQNKELPDMVYQAQIS